MSDRDSLYFSEEELSELIRQVEETEMLKAPAYLKRETMELLSKGQGSLAGPKRTAPVRLTERQSRIQLLVYSVKVSAAAAAAIAMLFWMPAGELGPVNPRERFGVVEHLEESSSQLCRALNDVSRWLISGKRREELREK